MCHKSSSCAESSPVELVTATCSSSMRRPLNSRMSFSDSFSLEFAICCAISSINVEDAHQFGRGECNSDQNDISRSAWCDHSYLSLARSTCAAERGRAMPLQVGTKSLALPLDHSNPQVSPISSKKRSAKSTLNTHLLIGPLLGGGSATTPIDEWCPLTLQAILSMLLVTSTCNCQ